MKILYFLLSILFLVSCSEKQDSGSEDLQKLYDTLDAEISRSKEYEKRKESRIADLKKRFDLTGDSHRRTALIDSLIIEFEAYNADSTLYYISYNLRRPDINRIPGEHTRLMIQRLNQYAHAGFFSDAIDIINHIPRDSLTDDLLEEYYSACCNTYQYLSEYTSEHETSEEYEKKRALYSDSLKMVVKPGSFNHLVHVMSEKARRGEPEVAIKGLLEHLKEYPSGTREFSILASTLSYIYKTSGNDEEYKRYLVASAISDVQAAVKENMSFREMATVMFEDGDIERANRYLKKSIADANFYSAIMRNAQSTKMLPVIDEAYASMQHRLNTRLRIMVVVSGILSVILIVAIFLLLKQFNKAKSANLQVRKANEELSEMASRLKTLNEELEKGNLELKEYNRTKEQYAGLFMEACSSAISTLQRYQQSLRVAAAQGGNRAALMKKLESSEVADKLLKDFYVKFDEAILNIYPSFIEKFNALLNPGEQVVLKSGELLNTELRLFALIRIGIDDSAQIAQFLRCSISTVYTYRSKMRKRSRHPDDFESEVKQII